MENENKTLNKKFYIYHPLSKDENIKHEAVKKEITKCFEDKNYFLDLNNKIKIEQRTKNGKFILKFPITSLSLLSKIKNQNKKMPLINKFVTNTRKSNSVSCMGKKNESYNIVNGEILKHYFGDIKNNHLTKKNKEIERKIFLNNLPLRIKRKLINQENNLKNYKNNLTFNKNISQILMKKTHKSEGELLMNQNEEFYLKKTINNEIEKNIPKQDKLGNNLWYETLRSGFSYSQKNIFNKLANKTFNFFVSKDSNLLGKNSSMININKKKNNLYKKVNFQTLEVNGKNLFDIEYNMAIQPGKKFLYKKYYFDKLNIDEKYKFKNMIDDKVFIIDYKSINHKKKNSNSKEIETKLLTSNLNTNI